ncbi:uncharacterized protein LOC105158293 isoform X2 [Sesamum indicum]|uniref:Uncharacterized protein LOC105158293 isoform X2 n=1 Tax=Sesamum indicum TaxID=4182 RepID=A0A6I9STA1_SESIN|nr:uncharacterized protein LOC105158293 isoform X2 [Sesamum indicum]
MGCGNPPSATAPKEEQDKFSLTTKPIGADRGGQTHGANSFGADIMNFPFISLGYTHFAQHEGDCLSYPECKNGNNRLGGYRNLNCLNYKTDTNLMSVRSDMSDFHRESAISYPDSSINELCHATDRNNAIKSDSLMNTAFSSMDSHKTAVQMNFIPQRCEATTGYPIKAHGTEAKKVKISGSQMRGKYSSSECSSSVLPLVDNFPVTGNKNDLNIVPLPFSSPQNVDWKFLTLGIGGGTEIGSNTIFSSREIASKLEDAVSSQSKSALVGQSPMNPFSLAHLTGRAARIQTNAGRLSSSASNLAGRISTSYGGGLIGDTSTRNPMPFPSLQTPQAAPQLNFSAKHDTSVFDSTASSLPFRSTLISQPECVTRQPEITNSTNFASQSVSRQQDCGRSSINISCKSSRNYLRDRHRGSSISHAQLGELIPLTEGGGTESGAGICLPGSIQPVGRVISLAEGTRVEVPVIGSSPPSVQVVGNSLFPKRIGFQVSKGSTFESAAGPFPKRLGVQLNDFATARTGKGLSPVNLAAQVNPCRPALPSGQHQHGVPAQLSKDFPRVDCSNGEVIPVAKLDVRPQVTPFVSHPSLKRQATENSPDACLGQHRKFFPRPIIHHSVAHQRQIIPAIPVSIPATVHIPPAPLHVKWQGFDAPLEPTGHKCLLCKRDLSFTAEGPVYQPAIPPAVAVLPCGHTFHDQCLQVITPENQAKSPPCIPCAIGET